MKTFSIPTANQVKRTNGPQEGVQHYEHQKHMQYTELKQ
jgi:hypothetical protein